MKDNKEKQRKIRFDRLALLAVPIVAIAASVSCGSSSSIKRTDKTKQEPNSSENSSEAEIESTTQSSGGKVNITAFGDNLVQKRVYESAQNHAENGQEYNFGYVYNDVEQFFKWGDLRIMNQETPICNDEYEITGSDYNFNSPTQLGDYIIDSGINCISMANNHILDKGTDGLRAQLDYWDRKQQENSDLTVYGVYRNEQDMENIRIREVNGIKVALLAFTENTNGYTIDEGSDMKVVYTQDPEAEELIKKADQMADVVVVSAHWGDEDTFDVRDGVRAMAQDYIDWGADVIIGNHPHVAQTMEYLTRDDGTKGFVMYALGNFVSAQTFNINLLGEVVNFDCVVDPNTKAVSVENIKSCPVITQYDDGNLSNLRVVPYFMYNDKYVADHGLPNAPYSDAEHRQWSMDIINSFIQQNVPQEFQYLTNPFDTAPTDPVEGAAEVNENVTLPASSDNSDSSDGSDNNDDNDSEVSGDNSNNNDESYGTRSA